MQRTGDIIGDRRGRRVRAGTQESRALLGVESGQIHELWRYGRARRQAAATDQQHMATALSQRRDVRQRLGVDRIGIVHHQQQLALAEREHQAVGPRAGPVGSDAELPVHGGDEIGLLSGDNPGAIEALAELLEHAPREQCLAGAVRSAQVDDLASIADEVQQQLLALVALGRVEVVAGAGVNAHGESGRAPPGRNHR